MYSEIGNWNYQIHFFFGAPLPLLFPDAFVMPLVLPVPFLAPPFFLPALFFPADFFPDFLADTLAGEALAGEALAGDGATGATLGALGFLGALAF